MNILLLTGLSFLIDFVLLGIVIVFVFIGIKRGLTKSVFSFFGLGLSVLCSYLFRNTASMILDKIFMCKSFFTLKVANYFAGLSSQFSSIVSSDATTLKHIVNSSNVSFSIKALANSAIESTALTSAKSVCFVVGEKIGAFFTVALAMLLVYIVVRICLFFLAKLFSLFNKNAMCKNVDRSLGGVFGALKGLCVVVIAILSLNLLSKVPSLSNQITTTINDSVVTKACYEEFDKYVFSSIKDSCGVGFDDFALPFFK